MPNLLFWDSLFGKKEDLLPTVLFILAAYALYALVMWWCRWQRAHLWAKRHQDRARWPTFLGSAAILGLFLWLLLWLAPAARDQNLRLAGILGLTEGDPKLAEPDPPPAPVLQPETKAANGQPVYALLHPASPPSLQPPRKPPAGNFLRRPKGQGCEAKKSPNPKTVSKFSKKDKPPAKIKVLKKKSS